MSIDYSFCHDVHRGATMCLSYEADTNELKWSFAFTNPRDRYIRAAARQICLSRIVECEPVFMDFETWKAKRATIRFTFFDAVERMRLVGMNRKIYQRSIPTASGVRDFMDDYIRSLENND